MEGNLSVLWWVFLPTLKNMSQINTGESQPGMYNPILSDINFVIPDTKTIQTFSPYGQAFGQMKSDGT